MRYNKTIKLKNGKEAIIRNGEAKDGFSVFETFNKTHDETDFLTSYPDENSYNPEEEANFLQKSTDSSNEIQLIAVVDGLVVGLAGIESIGSKDKLKHRAEFGICILKDYWGLGIGKELSEACIACAKEAGYEQLELQAVADNKRAIELYENLGYVEFGRNPRGFKSRYTGFQELVYMRLEL